MAEHSDSGEILGVSLEVKLVIFTQK